ncbi:hypothetical protein [Streptomyces sp. NPDC046942]|uniref:hypothetical protein n=1 Tax=Streptomyces sp. NPDC046942 TaxID=3155137 RepID=UPI0033C7DF0C
MDLSEEFGDWHGAGRPLCALGLVHDRAGEASWARSCRLRAAEVYDRAGAAQDAAHVRRTIRIAAGTAPR